VATERNSAVVIEERFSAVFLMHVHGPVTVRLLSGTARYTVRYNINKFKTNSGKFLYSEVWVRR